MLFDHTNPSADAVAAVVPASHLFVAMQRVVAPGGSSHMFLPARAEPPRKSPKIVKGSLKTNSPTEVEL